VPLAVSRLPLSGASDSHEIATPVRALRLVTNRVSVVGSPINSEPRYRCRR
jgi:hypothetical protein